MIMKRGANVVHSQLGVKVHAVVSGLEEWDTVYEGRSRWGDEAKMKCVVVFIRFLNISSHGWSTSVLPVLALCFFWYLLRAGFGLFVSGIHVNPNRH